MSLLQSGVDVSNTEGMIDASVFPINYFTVSQLLHFWPDAIEKVTKYIAQKA